MKIQVALAVAFLALAPVPASAESQEDQNACMNDAFSVCGHAIPDRDARRRLPRAEHQPHLRRLPHGDAALFQADGHGRAAPRYPPGNDRVR